MLGLASLHCFARSKCLHDECAGAAAISSLSKDCIENNFRLGKEGCISVEWCIDIMKMYPEEQGILIAICSLLGVLAENGSNCAKMGTSGACEEVLACLKRHPNSAALSVAACNAIGRYAIHYC